MAQKASPLVAALSRELGKYPQLDPKAVLAIAAHEGLSGGIGDQGTSFGPFQLHKGGALPGNIPLSGANQWAWSPAGLNYALSRIAGVAGGLHGLNAISAISRRFERPADPAAEIADAARHYGLAPVGGASVAPSYGGGVTSGVAAAPASASAPVQLRLPPAPVDTRPAFARALTGAIDSHGLLSNPMALAAALQTLRG